MSSFSISDRMRACLPCCSTSSPSPSPSYDDLRARLLEDADDAMSLHSNYHASAPADTPRLSRWTLLMSLFAGSRVVRKPPPEAAPTRPIIAAQPEATPTLHFPLPDDDALAAEEAALAAAEEAEQRKARRRARRRARELGLALPDNEGGSSVAGDTEYDFSHLPPLPASHKGGSSSSASGSSSGRRRRRRHRDAPSDHTDDWTSATATSATERSFTFSPRLTGHDEAVAATADLIYYPQLALGLDGQPLLDSTTGEPLFLLDDAGQPIYAPFPPPVSFLVPPLDEAAAEVAAAPTTLSTHAFLSALAKKKRPAPAPAAVAPEAARDVRAESSDDEERVDGTLARMAEGAGRRMRFEGDGGDGLAPVALGRGESDDEDE